MDRKEKMRKNSRKHFFENLDFLYKDKFKTCMKKYGFPGIFGWFASCMTIGMYVSYIDQIRRNISGNPGSFVLPVITFVNCVAWVLYGLLKPKKDWPIIVCNLPGIAFGLITAITALR